MTGKGCQMENKKPKNISRREFLKDAGSVIGGAAIASLTLSSACKGTETTSVSTTSATTSTPTVSATSSSPPATTTLNNIPYLVGIPGMESKVALDRLYSVDHVWVKDLGDNTVQIGLTEKCLMLIGNVRLCYIPPVGTITRAGNEFGYTEGFKINLSLVSPVSGEVVKSNQKIVGEPTSLNNQPYVQGWLLNIKLSNPDELNDLVSPMYYAYLQSKEWVGPIPDKR
jgi:glycine cleavage system H protein